MRRPWFSTRPLDETFFDSAPLVLRETFAIARPAADVWGELTAERPLGWCRIVDDATWTSPRPFGVGSTRTVTVLRGANAFKVHFFRWEEGRRKSFYALECGAPLFRRFAEDYLVEPVSDTSSRFTWTIALDPRLGALTNPVNKLVLGTLLRDTRRHFAAGGARFA